MAALRRTLRLCAATWLVFQVAWLTAVVPRACCATHRPAEDSRHEAASATHCPMRGADGQPCSMHRGHADRGTQHHGAAADGVEHHGVATEHHRSTAPGPLPDCRLSGVCDGPMAALFVLLSHQGILPESTETVPRLSVQSAGTTIYQSVTSRFEPPDPPPPRA